MTTVAVAPSSYVTTSAARSRGAPVYGAMCQYHSFGVVTPYQPRPSSAASTFSRPVRTRRVTSKVS